MTLIMQARSMLAQDFTKKKRGESMNYLAAIVCVLALVFINIFGTESKDINSILSAAIAGCIWGGIQRGAVRQREDGDEPAHRRPTKRASPKTDPE